MSELTFSEREAGLAIEDQSDGQLLHSFNELTSNTDEFDVVEYIIIPKNRIAFPVKKNFFVMSLLNELCYRNLL